MKNKFIVIVVKIFKGRGILDIEDVENWYGKLMLKERVDVIIKLIES